MLASLSMAVPLGPPPHQPFSRPQAQPPPRTPPGAPLPLVQEAAAQTSQCPTRPWPEPATPPDRTRSEACALPTPSAAGPLGLCSLQLGRAPLRGSGPTEPLSCPTPLGQSCLVLRTEADAPVCSEGRESPVPLPSQPPGASGQHPLDVRPFPGRSSAPSGCQTLRPEARRQFHRTGYGAMFRGPPGHPCCMGPQLSKDGCRVHPWVRRRRPAGGRQPPGVLCLVSSRAPRGRGKDTPPGQDSSSEPPGEGSPSADQGQGSWPPPTWRPAHGCSWGQGRAWWGLVRARRPCPLLSVWGAEPVLSLGPVPTAMVILFSKQLWP